MDFHGAVDIKQNIVKNMALENLSDFPAVPKAGLFIFKDNKIFLCVSVQGVLTWVPVTNEISVQVFNNKSGLEWTLPHTFGSNPVLVQVYNTQGEQIVPDNIDCSISGQATIRFSMSVTGKAIMLAGEQIGPIGTGPVTEPFSNITDTPTTLAGYGIVDAYTKTESTAILENIFANDLSLKGVTVSSPILPATSSTIDIGSATNRFRAIYVDDAYLSINTLYLGDTAVLKAGGSTVSIHPTVDQSISLSSTGVGSTSIASGTTLSFAAPTINVVGSMVVTGTIDQLETEKTRALAAEDWLASAIQSEANTRAAVDNSVADQFQAEADARTAADNDLSNRIDLIVSTPVDWNATSGSASIINKPLLSAVATSGSFADLQNVPQLLTGADVDSRIQAVVGAAPAALDTLAELSTALGNDANFASSITTQLATKANISSLASVATSGSYNDLLNKPVIPAAQVQSDWNAVSGVAAVLNKPTFASVATTGSYNDLIDKPAASSNVQSDWNAVSGAAVILNKPTLSTVATTGSYNDLTNKPVTAQADWTASTGASAILNKPTLSTAAISGSYNDLTNKPSIPAAQVQSDWTAVSGMGVVLNKPTFAAVATSGNYADLSNKPAIPTAVSSLTNDAGYQTASNVTTLISSSTAGSASSLNTSGNYQVNSLGVGTAASGVAGEIRATNNITAYYSDARLKNVVGNIQNALASVCTLNGVVYTSNEVAASYGYTSQEQQVGVLAQEVEAVLPQVVTAAPFDIGQDENGNEFSKSGQNFMTVRYERIVPLLIEAIKDLKTENDALRARLDAIGA